MTAPAVAGAAALLALDAAYRAAVARTSLEVARVLMVSWTSVDPDDLSGTSTEWLRSSLEAVLAGQRNATEIANAYTEQVRRIQAPRAPVFTLPAPPPPNVEQVRRSLEYTGIKQTAIELGRLQAVRDGDIEAEPEDADRTLEGRKRQLVEDAVRRAVGSAIRLVTTAGHDQLIQNVQQDGAALGWARTTKPGSCYFCAMLASRGFVYKKDSFEASNAQFQGIGEQKVHDNCGCGLRPIYNTSDAPPDRMRELEQMWIDMTTETGKGGQAAIREFRRRYEASPLAQPAQTAA